MPDTRQPLTPQQQVAEAAALAVIVEQQAKAYAKLNDKTVAAVKRLMGKLYQRWYFQDEVDAVAQELADTVRHAQEAVADMTETYMDRVFEVMDIKKLPSKQKTHVKLPAPRVLRDVDPLTEWNRPARDARVGRLFKGLDEFAANERALKRAEEQAEMDLQLAMREAERQRWETTDDIIGYRRIIHPELPGNVCGLCVVASSRVYRTEDLKPIHNGCRCTVLPVLKHGDLTHDPGKTMNRDELDAYYAAAGSNTRADLQRVKVISLAHGELGPILVNNKYRNRTASQTKKLADLVKTSQELFDLQDKIVKDFEAAVRAGRTPQFDIDYHRRQRDRLAKELGLEVAA